MRTSFSKKAPQKILRVLHPTRISPFVVPTRKEAPTGNAPMGAIPLKAVTSPFPREEENPTSEAPGVVFDPAIEEGGVETPLPNDSSKASLSPPVGGRLRSFRRDWLTNKCSQNVLNIITNGYVLPFRSKPNLIRFPLILSRVQGPTKRPSLGYLYPVSPVKERYRKGRQCKISRVLQSPVPSTQASPKVEASHRLKQAQYFSTRRKVQNGNSRVHQDLPDSRGVGIVDRPVGRLPAHPHPPKLKEIPKVLLQGSGVPVHLPPVRTSHSPPGLYNDRKGSETNGPLKRTQNSPIPGRLADQVPVSGGSTSEHSGSSRTDSVLGVDNKSGKIRTETYSGVFVRGLRIPPRFSPCKTHSREMAQTSGFDPTTQVKTCFDCKMFDVSNWVASLNGENGPGGTPSHEALSVSPQGALEISSVAGQPPSLDRSHCSPPRWVAKSLQCDERCRSSSQRPQYPTLYRRLKRRLGRSLRPKFYKGSVVGSGKKATHKCPRIEGGLPGPSRLQGPVPESNSVGCDGQLNSGSLHQQTRRNTLGRDVCSPVEDHDLVPSLPHNIESQAHSRVPECDG